MILTRFPSDFMFQLTKPELKLLTFQIGISKTKGRGCRRTLPYPFTEQGVAMLSSVFNSKRAVRVNITIMVTHKDLARKLQDVERKYGSHDVQIKRIFACIRKLMEDISVLFNPTKA